MEHIDDIIARAIRRGEEASSVDPRAIAANYDPSRNMLVLELAGGAELAIPASALGFPPNADLSIVQVEGGGFDLYFPAIDEGAFVPTLVRAAIEHRLAA